MNRVRNFLEKEFKIYSKDENRVPMRRGGRDLTKG
jgi:hypothetical protein